MQNSTVLVVDDDAAMRRALQKRLSSMGYGVVEAADGRMALMHLDRSSFGVVILDHEMAGMNGRSLAIGIRRQFDVPIVFLTGHDREAFRPVIMRLADTYYLSKPLDSVKFSSLLCSLSCPSWIPALQ